MGSVPALVLLPAMLCDDGLPWVCVPSCGLRIEPPHLQWGHMTTTRACIVRIGNLRGIRVWR